jgi:SAM-dependent methyltransferase
MDPIIKQQVIDSFSSENSVKKYTHDVEAGLWDSENILIDRYFAKGSSVLDLGCGVGRTTIPLFDKGYKVVGVDVTPTFIAGAKDVAARQNKQIDFRVGDATHLEFANNAFDNALFSFNGWTMIPTKEARLEAAREVYRVLKPGGCYIFTAHKRVIFGQELQWLIQLIKLNILKPLGYKTDEKDFGDFYFNRDAETTYPVPQFVNIPSVKEVVELYKNIGFELIYSKMRSEVTKKDDNLTSGDVMFFVFKKL